MGQNAHGASKPWDQGYSLHAITDTAIHVMQVAHPPWSAVTINSVSLNIPASSNAFIISPMYPSTFCMHKYTMSYTEDTIHGQHKFSLHVASTGISYTLAAS